MHAPETVTHGERPRDIALMSGVDTTTEPSGKPADQQAGVGRTCYPIPLCTCTGDSDPYRQRIDHEVYPLMYGCERTSAMTRYLRAQNNDVIHLWNLVPAAVN